DVGHGRARGGAFDIIVAVNTIREAAIDQVEIDPAHFIEGADAIDPAGRAVAAREAAAIDARIVDGENLVIDHVGNVMRRRAAQGQRAGQTGADLRQGRAIAGVNVKALGVLAGEIIRLNGDRGNRPARIGNVLAIGRQARRAEIDRVLRGDRPDGIIDVDVIIVKADRETGDEIRRDHGAHRPGIGLFRRQAGVADRAFDKTIGACGQELVGLIGGNHHRIGAAQLDHREQEIEPVFLRPLRDLLVEVETGVVLRGILADQPAIVVDGHENADLHGLAPKRRGPAGQPVEDVAVEHMRCGDIERMPAPVDMAVNGMGQRLRKGLRIAPRHQQIVGRADGENRRRDPGQP
ncbi:hypothetical protein E4T56_gene9191, partial [Termitomyces sp. T112]